MRHAAVLATAYFAALVPGIVAVYNPHQYEGDPLLQPVAVRPVLVVALVAVLVMFYFGRRWTAKTVSVVLSVGVGLTLLSFASLMLASARPMREAGPFLLTAALAGNLAIPCVGVLSAAILQRREATRA